MYVRGKLDEGFYVVVTGSNASMLSRELGTKLTGRHITKELFLFLMQNIVVIKNKRLEKALYMITYIKEAFRNTCN